MSDPQFHTVRHELGDETVTLYTDGVTEARTTMGVLFGEERLATLSRDAARPARHRRAVVGAALEWQSDDASDDIAVVSFAAT